MYNVLPDLIPDSLTDLGPAPKLAAHGKLSLILSWFVKIGQIIAYLSISLIMHELINYSYYYIGFNPSLNNIVSVNSHAHIPYPIAHIPTQEVSLLAQHLSVIYI